MSVSLEDRITTGLRVRADAVTVVAPPLEEIVERPPGARRTHRRRTSERVLVAAALVAFVAAGVVLATMGREDVTQDGPTAPPPTESVSGRLAEVLAPGALVALPEPWRLGRFQFVSAAAMTSSRSEDVEVYDADGQQLPLPVGWSTVEYTFTDGVRTLQLDFYPLGVRPPSVTTPEPPLVPVRGTTGYFLDYGAGRYRIQWDEDGRTWEADGHGFESLDELSGALGQIERLDDDAWAARMPAGLADAIRTHPDGSVGWNAEENVLHTTLGALGPAPTVPPGS
jgi:hypothetical protein